MVEHARGDDRMIAGEGARDVLDALARADAKLVRLQVDGMAADLRRRQLHRVSRPRARLFEIERDALVLDDVRMGRFRQIENLQEIVRRQIADGEQMPHAASFVIIVPTP